MKDAVKYVKRYCFGEHGDRPDEFTTEAEFTKTAKRFSKRVWQFPYPVEPVDGQYNGCLSTSAVTPDQCGDYIIFRVPANFTIIHPTNPNTATEVHLKG